MSSRLLKTKAVYKTCKEHLESLQTQNPEIAAYITEHILVVLCANVQQDILKIVEERANQSGDSQLSNYSITTCKRVLRSVKQKEISGFIKNFGEQSKLFFNSNVDEKKMTIYNGAVIDRHKTAHSTGGNITFRELNEIIICAEHLLDIVEKAVNLRP